MPSQPLIPIALGLCTTITATLTAQDKPTPTSKPEVRNATTARPTLFDAKGRVIGAPDGGGAGGKWGGRQRGRARLGARLPGLGDAIRDGLAWLHKHQDRDGGFDAGAFMRHDKTGKKSDAPGEGLGRVGITGFCLLPFLGDGSTLSSGPHRDVVRKGIDWLRRQQLASGAYSPNLLEHTLATYAVVEAAGLSRSKILGTEAHSALQHLARQQNADGGFSSENQGRGADAFTTTHAVIAYRSGLDFRFVTDRAPLTLIKRWLASASKASGNALIAQGTKSAATPAAARLLVNFFLGHSPRQNPAMGIAADTISEHRPSADPKEADPVFYYLATYGLYQMGGRYFSAWQRDLLPAVIETQRDDGNSAGSWDPVGKGARFGGRLYSTTLSILALESYYRYTRLVR